jgi:hypothetical protein
MSNEKNVIEVPLPDNINDAREVDLDLLKAIFQAIVSLRFEDFPNREALQKKVEEDGWTVRWGLTWIAQAKRGQDYEFAIGQTTEEALCKLYHSTQLGTREGCP